MTAGAEGGGRAYAEAVKARLHHGWTDSSDSFRESRYLTNNGLAIPVTGDQPLLEEQTEIVSLLVRLTRDGHARWFRRSGESEVVYCYVGGDLVEFLAFDESGDPADPSQYIHAVKGRYRAVDNLFWLEGTSGWGDLISLLRAARIDDDAFRAAYHETRQVTLRHLRSVG